MSDVAGASGERIIKITSVYAADANVPGVLVPFEADWLDLINSKAHLSVEKNGIPVITGPAAGAGIEIYPGTDLDNGDIKTASGLAVDDILTIRYGIVLTRYAEI